MATVGLFFLQGECDDTDSVKMARCFHETDCTTDYLTGVTSCPDPCPADGVSLQRLCDLIDGALLALNLSLGPQVLVLTALVMFTSVQVCLHTCCFGETTKKGAAFTCQSSAPRSQYTPARMQGLTIIDSRGLCRRYALLHDWCVCLHLDIDRGLHLR
jgi:hypothetical protein